MSKTVIILRAASGAGKSTFADYISELSDGNTIICSADDYFITNGKYLFDPRNLGKAHFECQRKFLNALSRKESLIIVSNTNSKESEFKYYEEAAKDFGYTTFFLVLEKRHNGENQHDCPDYSIEMQANNIKSNLKLC